MANLIERPLVLSATSSANSGVVKSPLPRCICPAPHDCSRATWCDNWLYFWVILDGNLDENPDPQPCPAFFCTQHIIVRSKAFSCWVLWRYTSYLYRHQPPESKGFAVGNYTKLTRHNSKPWIPIKASILFEGLLSVSFYDDRV